MLAFLLWLSDFKTKTSFGFLIKKSGVIFYFFEKSKKWARIAKNDVLAILAKIWWFSDNGDTYANLCLMIVELARAYGFLNFL